MTKDEIIGFLKGNAHKYNFRAKLKENELEDYKKGQWYQNRLVSFMENE